MSVNAFNDAPGGPARMDHHERMRVRNAAFQAVRSYPGPIGELIKRELLAWEEMGWRLDRSGLVQRLVAEVLKPQESAA